MPHTQCRHGPGRLCVHCAGIPVPGCNPLGGLRSKEQLFLTRISASVLCLESKLVSLSPWHHDTDVDVEQYCYCTLPLNKTQFYTTDVRKSWHYAC